jgi:hypothetical protein
MPVKNASHVIQSVNKLSEARLMGLSRQNEKGKTIKRLKYKVY